MAPLLVLLGIAFAAFAAFTAYVGLGLPNHPYQLAVAAAALGIAYHRKHLPRPKKALDWAVVTLNAGVLAMLMKLFIGGGVRSPFSWLKLPTVQAGSEGWLPKVVVGWQTLSLTEWTVDLTLAQSFLLLVTAVGAWLRFQPFASLTALLLLLVSIPAYVDFRWDWLLPALFAACASFYVQASSAEGRVPRPVSKS